MVLNVLKTQFEKQSRHLSPLKKSCIQQVINPLKKAEGVRPVSPSPATSASSLAAPPGPRPHAASRSSTRPAAHSACSSWGCPSSDQRCEPSDANKERGENKPSQPPCRHILEMLKKRRQLEKVLFFWFQTKMPCLVLTCQCSSRSRTCCLSSFRPVRASASLSFTPISSS